MLCHDKTRFILFMAGLKKNDFANLGYWFEDIFANTLLKMGYDTDLIEQALALLTPAQFDTCCDRSVQGSMRTVRSMELEIALHRAANVMELMPYSTSAKLNNRSVTVKGMKKSECLWPKRAMQAWLEQVTVNGLH